MLMESDKTNVRFLLAIFVGRPRAESMTINEQVVEVVYKMLEEAQKCSKRIDLLPRPTGFAPGLSYILKQIAQIVWRIERGEQDVYDMCKNVVMYSWGTELELAERGLR